MISIVLHSPNIPGNTGSVGRTCVALNYRLVLIKPYGFDLDEKSVQFARLVEKQFKERVGRRSLGVKQSSLYLLWSTAMPSVLVEVGYLSNPKEEKYLNDKRNQVYIASGIYRAFKEYKKEIEKLN